MANSTDAEATLKKFVARINAHDPSGIIALCTTTMSLLTAWAPSYRVINNSSKAGAGTFPCFRITASRWSQRFLAARSFSLAVSPRRRTRRRRRLGAFQPRGAPGWKMNALLSGKCTRITSQSMNYSPTTPNQSMKPTVHCGISSECLPPTPPLAYLSLAR
jgi:hypothetical protein